MSLLQRSQVGFASMGRDKSRVSEELERFFALKARYQQAKHALVRHFILEEEFVGFEAGLESPKLRRSVRSFIEDERQKRQASNDRYLENYRQEREAYIRERMLVMERWSRGQIQRSTAASLIQASAWWLTHSSGHPVRAPGHASRIRQRTIGWSIEFGANHFLIGKFIEGASECLIAGFDLAGTNKILDTAHLHPKLRAKMRGCVANYNLDTYDDYAPQRGQLVFGAQAIDVDDACNYLITASGLRRYCFDPRPMK